MGTKHELEQFLRGVERKAYRIAQAATGHSDDAIDIVQDAMMKLTQKYADKPAQEWAPLFTRILQSRILDWHRRTSVRKRFTAWFAYDADATEQEDPLQLVADPVDARPENILQQRGAMDVLSAAIQQLPIRQRQAFMLRAWEGLNVAETAAAMAVSEGSVKTHYFRALAALREKLEDHWP
jgi:RNA polymerase sigma-70 factor, ECF subfamily